MIRRPLSLLVVLGCLLQADPSSALEKRPEERWPSALERGRYQAKISSTGQILWSVDWETHVREEKGQAQVEIRETGQGQPWSYSSPITWQKRMTFSSPQPLSMQVESVRGQRHDLSGNLLSEMEVRMDPPSGRILYQDTRRGQKPKPSVFPWSPQVLPDELLFHWARTLPYEEEAAAGSECLLLVSPQRKIRMQAQIRGTEKVTTPAGTFSCYRVDLLPQLLGPLKALAPKMTLWCRTDPPHSWVRYQGPIGGPGSPQATIELVHFDSKAGKEER